MRYLKYMILVTVIIIIIIILIMLHIVQGENYIHTDEIEDSALNIDVNRNIEVVKNRANYYTVKKIVESYFYSLTQFNMEEKDILIFEEDEEANRNTLAETIEEEKKASKNKVYNCLDKEFISNNGITKDNIQEKLGNYKNVIILLDNMYYIDSNENVKIYFVEGKVIEKETRQKTEFSMRVSVDTQNSAFEIYPNEDKVEVGKEILVKKEKIENNKFNNYSYKIINDEIYSTDIFNDYKNRLMYDVESLYNRLDENYQKAKTSNETEFIDYIKNNYYKYVRANLNKYELTKVEDYERIIYEDSNGNYYIFKVTAPMKYTLILDTYTIDIPEFTERYKKSNDQEKVILNLNKFMLAINDGDYKYAYNVLADSFKNKNFPVYEEFENYVKSNFFKENKFEYTNFGNEAGTYYTYTVKITDGSKASDNTITKTFIILLEEGTNFKISFNV